MLLLLISKFLGILGVSLLAIPVIRDGKFFILLTPLGKRTQNKALLTAITTLKNQYNEELVKIRESDLRLIYFGLLAVVISYVLEIFYLLFLSP